ncbi:unnamed protein product [Blepharisma stoltei]|uniref:Uncharacterized protein n=1 Tax=Blepharisma stoltei TaxID=1481888 RepID=A0AAU9IDW9_9CILI|nr:unnamed protein product [Blepharisma stoltei]
MRLYTACQLNIITLLKKKAKSLIPNINQIPLIIRDHVSNVQITNELKTNNQGCLISWKFLLESLPQAKLLEIEAELARSFAKNSLRTQSM